MIIGTIFSPAQFAQPMIVILERSSDTRLTTFLNPFSAITLVGVHCMLELFTALIAIPYEVWLIMKIQPSNHFPQIIHVIGDCYRIKHPRPRTAQLFRILSSGCRFMRPFHQPLPGALFLKAATFMRLHNIQVLAKSCFPEIPMPRPDASTTWPMCQEYTEDTVDAHLWSHVVGSMPSSAFAILV